MNVLVEIDFKQGKRYYAIERVVYNSIQYIKKINSISNLSLNLGDDKDFQVSSVEIVFDDSDGHFTDILNSEWNKYILGITVDLYQEDGTTIRKMYLQDWQLNKSQNTFIVIASDNCEELNRNVIPVIDENEFPNAGTDLAYGEPIPRIYQNNYNQTTTPYIKCWRVEAGVGYDFLASSNEIDSLVYVEDSSGVDRTGVSSIANDGTYYYITYNGTDDYILINAREQAPAPYTAYEVIEDILATYFTNFGGDSWSDSTLEDYLTKMDVQQFYAIGEQNTGQQLLKHICDSFQFEWIVNADRGIEFKFIDFTDLSTVDTFKQEDIYTFEITDYDTSHIKNTININLAYTNHDSTYTQKQQLQKTKSVNDWGTFIGNLNLRFADHWLSSGGIRFTDGYKAFKRYTLLYMKPRIICKMSLPIDKFISAIEPGDLIGVTHDDAQGTGERLYQVRNIDLDLISHPYPAHRHA